ncbi:uncharacterized protein YceK [Pedobacter cryoconitis]|uniref:Uncharacterized protein YceK n=1 Tax=Pedobacter cryoconitis TaxID=188932 RepID=A0A7W9DIP2_9SPHI|nr:hypothetical protein [Pedobacter cryoconitis]MBB5620348.1 uncharacterized protein YceK [Pedobacter cryoconitis]
MKNIHPKTIYLFICSLLIILSGCGTSHHVFRATEKSKQETAQQTKKDTVSLTLDHSLTTIREKADTILVIPGQVITTDTYIDYDDLVNGVMAIKSPLAEVSLILNPVTKKLSARAFIKEQVIPLKINKETVIRKNLTVLSKKNELSLNTNKSEAEQTLKEKETLKLSTWLPALLILIALGSAFYWIRNKSWS